MSKSTVADACGHQRLDRCSCLDKYSGAEPWRQPRYSAAHNGSTGKSTMKSEATAIATSALENSEILHGRLVMQEKQQQQKELYRSA